MSKRFKTGAEIKVGGEQYSQINKIYPRSQCAEVTVNGQKARQGKFTFVPLVDINDFDNPDSKIAQHGVFARFQYSFQVPGTEGKIDYKRVTWLDSSMRKDEGFAHDDPGIRLGLNLPAKERVLNPGFNGAPASKYADSRAYAQEYILPVLWGVEIDEEQDVIIDGSGEVSLLVLSKFQLNILKDAVNKSPPKFVRWFNSSGEIEKYDFNGVGLAIYFEIDTSKKLDSYSFALSKPARESHVVDNVEYALELLFENFENTRKFEQAYWLFVEQNEAETLSDEDCDNEVYAWIARRLLKAWGFEQPSDASAQTVIDAFNEISNKYSLAQEAQIGNAVVSSEVIRPNKPGKKSDDKTQKPTSVEDDNPF